MPPLPGRTEDEGDEAESGRRWPWLLGGLLALALGGGVLAATMLLGSAPEVEPPAPPLIRAATAERAAFVNLRQTGFIRPLAAVPIAAEIQGRITEVSDQFRRGNFVEAGEVLIRLETRQLRAEVGRAEASVGRAEAGLAEARVERDRQRQLEAQEFASEAALQQSIVAVATAEAELTAARADLIAARTRLDDATITAPFDALVVEDAADVGDIAQPGTELGRLVASEAAEVEFGLTPADLDLLGEAERAIGGRVLIRPATAAVREAETDLLALGVVSDVGPLIDEATRTVPLIVRIPRPFERTDDDRPLRVDELVALELPVSLERRTAVSVPAQAIKGGDTVWAVRPDAEAGDDPDGGSDGAARLLRVEVSILQRTGDVAVVEGPLPPGTLVMVSDLPGAADGARVRLERNRGSDADGSGGDDG
jgi:RND family efflux transporter MFP subunit